MDSFALIIFGITSNLVQKYILHTLYDMEEKGLLPENMSVIGNARSPKSKEDIKEYVHTVLNSENKHHKHPINNEVFERLVSRIHYLDGNLDNPKFYQTLKELLDELGPAGKNRIFYLATLPELYQHIFKNLKITNLNSQKNGWVKLLIEKPIGHDLASAQELNKLLTEYFTEDQIYRLDHYLGKETLQNILSFRFANAIFEPLMNKDYIDHIQITASEDYGIGKRGGYFDGVGMLKDVGQNHQMQMLAFATMNSPEEFSNKAITEERIKVLKSLKPLEVVFGQYQGYVEEENVAPNSQIDTFYALKTELDNERFRNVPIYIRAGKKLKKTVTEIAIVFKTPQNSLFKNLASELKPNILIYRIYPNEGIVLKILTKKLGHQVALEEQFMQYCYRQEGGKHTFPDPYERLISDAIKGDQTFFNDAEEVEASWKFIDPLIASKKQVYEYQPDSWGPKEADSLIEKDGRKWLEPSMDFCRI